MQKNGLYIHGGIIEGVAVFEHMFEHPKISENGEHSL